MNEIVAADTSALFATNPPTFVIVAGEPYQPGMETTDMFRLVTSRKHRVQQEVRRHGFSSKVMATAFSTDVWPEIIRPYGLPYHRVGVAGNEVVYRNIRR